MGLLIVVFLVFALAALAGAQNQSSVDLSAIEKEIAALADKPYHLGGFFEFQPSLLGIDRGSAFSRLRFYRDKQGHLSNQYGLRLRLEGSYKKDIYSLFLKTDTNVRTDFDGWDEDTKLFEAYASINPTPTWFSKRARKS